MAILNWKSTGINIYAQWNPQKSRIISLGLTEYVYWETPPYYMDSEPLFPIASLVLYDGQEPNEINSAMLRQFSESLINNKTYHMTEMYQNDLLANKNLILHGAPGTGKTYLAQNIASQIIIHKDKDVTLSKEEKDLLSSHIDFVQLHSSYDYTDFVEGLRPMENGDGNIGFKLKNRIFKTFANGPCYHTRKKLVKARKMKKSLLTYSLFMK